MSLTVDPRALYSSLSGELVPEKFEKYILLLVVSILLTLIPFNTGKTPVYCEQNSISSGTDSDARTGDIHSSSIASVTAGKETSKGYRKTCSKTLKNDNRDLLDSDKSDESAQCSDNLAVEDNVAEQMAENNSSGSGDVAHCFVRSAIRAICSYLLDPSQNNATNTSTTSRQKSVNADEATSSKDIRNRSDKLVVGKGIAEKACPGKRAKYYVKWLGWCFAITVGCIATHDLWIELSNKEIKKLKEIVEKNKKMEICDECMESLLKQLLKEWCPKCKDMDISDDAGSLREDLLKNQPKLDYLQRNYDMQNVINLCVILAAPFIVYWFLAPTYNYWFICEVEVPQYRSPELHKLSFNCYDESIDIVMGTIEIMVPFLIGLLCISLYKVIFAGAPYFKIFAILRNKSSGQQ